MTTNKKNTVKKYILLQNLPFGNLKKGMIFSYDSITKNAVFSNGQEISPFDVTDKNFVKQAADVPYNIGDTVVYHTRLYKITDINFATGYCNLLAFYANKTEDQVSYKLLETARVYWFVNSSGTVSSSYIGKQPDADLWRAKSKNMFETKEECQKYKNIVLNSRFI